MNSFLLISQYSTQLLSVNDNNKTDSQTFLQDITGLRIIKYSYFSKI